MRKSNFKIWMLQIVLWFAKMIRKLNYNFEGNGNYIALPIMPYYKSAKYLLTSLNRALN